MINIAHNHNKLMSAAEASTFRLAVWGIQIIVGLIGLWLAGAPAIAEVKVAGIKKAPKRLWRLFWYSEQ